MRQQPIFVIAVRAKSVCRRGGGGCICRRFAGVIMLGREYAEGGSWVYWMMAVGWWVYGLGYEIMFMRHVDALNIAICKLCFIFCRTARRIRNTRQTMRTYHTVTQPTPALPHPPFRRTHSICLLFGKCFYLCLRSFNYFCKLRCAHFRQLSDEI